MKKQKYYLDPAALASALVPEQRRIEVLPFRAPTAPAFRYRHEIPPMRETKYDWFFAHQVRHPSLTARQARRRRIREG
jgi:hypothetical protein